MLGSAPPPTQSLPHAFVVQMLVKKSAAVPKLPVTLYLHTTRYSGAAWPWREPAGHIASPHPSWVVDFHTISVQ